MSIVLQYDSRTNVTYAYHNDVTWDGQAKRSRQRRTLVGRVDPDTSLIIPTSGKRRKNSVDEEVIKNEIDAYNNRILHKDDAEEGISSSSDGKYEELLEKYDEIKKALISFSEAIQLIFNTKDGDQS